MCASPLKLLTAGPPPPRVALLPDHLFFTRSLPVSAEGAGEAAGTVPGIGPQVELALESVAPFPLSQLYYGYYWAPGADHALAFASYRRRFTAEQTDAWAGAEWVLPTFAAILGAPLSPATTVLLPSPEGLTAVHWGNGPVPNRVVFLPIPAGTAEDERAKLQEAFLRSFESKTLIELAEPPVAEAGERDGSVHFRAGEIVARFDTATAAALDVRDKEELAALRRARRRDVLFWHVGVACVLAFLFLGVGELVLVGGGLWQKARRTQLSAQAPLVEKITAQDEIAHKIEDLRDKRLLPMEMLTLVDQQRPSQNMGFIQMQASDLDRYSLSVRAETPNPAEIDVFHDKLQTLPSCQSVTVKTNSSNDKNTVFTLSITFKPDTIQPAPLPPPS
jgi:hypothetical protein